ncbi:hypothetical protein [Mucilaginibacter gilvus]|uniref:Uncharacterized protein n=1 Tax=Mucilaginibacter gilvus TaxID=2305909 RepID=A0A3S3WZC1_9SPHI|nr:hypothetical protein [Mucilaginibacter gilvus]RWY47119.1 hypothetical protein EPL05_22675 [Mucilaginibacter gilvus]
MKKLTVTLFAACSLIFFSCRKDAKLVQPNIETTISGRFYDDINKEPYQYVKLKIAEYKRHTGFYGGYDYQLISYRDSTITGIDGTYKIHFTTSGNGSNYFLEFNEIPETVNVSEKGNQPGAQNLRSKLIENLGTVLTYDFDFAKRYFMKTRVIVHDNPYPVLSITAFGQVQVYGKNKDTLINIPFFKYPGGFHLNFSVTDPVTHVTYKAPNVPLNPVVDKDTIEGGTYELYPAKFQ